MEQLKKAVAASFVAVVVALVGSLAVPGTASALTSSDCGQGFDNLQDVDTVRLNGGAVDFGAGNEVAISGTNDHRPSSNAIACFGNDSTEVLVKGKLFYDSSQAGCGRIRITSTDVDGLHLIATEDVCPYITGGSSRDVFEVLGSDQGLVSIKVELLRRLKGQKGFTRLATTTRSLGD